MVKEEKEEEVVDKKTAAAKFLYMYISLHVKDYEGNNVKNNLF